MFIKSFPYVLVSSYKNFEVKLSPVPVVSFLYFLQAEGPASVLNYVGMYLCTSASVSHVLLCVQNAEVTRQMTVARAAQDEVEEVRKEMQEKVKIAQEAADRQVRMTHILYKHQTRIL